MHQAIQDYCEHPDTTGLLLLDMPTGFGKTYHTLHVIYQQAMAHPEKKIFFMTTLKKNLPAAELKEIFEKNGQGKAFEKRFLQLEPNSVFLTEDALQSVMDDIPREIKRSAVFRKLRESLHFLASNQQHAIEIVKRVQQEVQMREEPAFRRMLTKRLKEQYPAKRKRLDALKHDREWVWVATLYPSVFTCEKQIFFLSVDKFLYPHATLVEPAYSFVTHEITDNALIFIDEVDAAKEVMLKKIINDTNHKIIDLIKLFVSIHRALQAEEFPRRLTEASDAQESAMLAQSIEQLKWIANNIYKKYALYFNYKVQAEENISQNFLFRDHLTHTLTNKRISIQQSSRDKLNYIVLSDVAEVDGAQNLAAMMGNMKGFLKKFELTIGRLAQNYAKTQTKARGEFSKEDAIRSILALFTLTDQQRNYLLSATTRNVFLQKSQYDLSFYENGFEYYAFEDHTEHDMHSVISMYQYHITPEKLLLAMCQKAKVIGISATATLQGVIGNFDVRYLKESLGDCYHVLSEQASNRIEAQFAVATKGYQHVTIQAQFLNERLQGQYGVQSITQFLHNPELIQAVFDLLQQKCGTSTSGTYLKERYLRIFMAYHTFVNHADIQAFLCLLTRFPKMGDDALDEQVLRSVFLFIKSECKNTDGKVLKNEFLLLSSERFEEEKAKMIQRLSQGEKLFVISTYQTLGAGQNIQYPVPSDAPFVRTNGLHHALEKDFDAIYLDMPTYVMSRVEESEDGYVSFIRRLFQIKYLEENAEISTRVAVKEIKASFNQFASPKEYAYSALPKDTLSKNMAITKIIMQAVGRICRTNLKNKTIYVFAAPDLKGALQNSQLERRLLNPEFRALLLHCEATEQKTETSAQQKASLISERANAYIHSILQYGFSERDIEFWHQLREVSLQKPTCTIDEAEHMDNRAIIKNFCVRLPAPNNCLWYRQTGDYKQVDVFFHKVEGQMLCAQNARLPELMKIPALRDYFLAHGYATDFAKGDYILSPVLFQNIYKGALGEVAGRHFFATYLGIALEELSEREIFEFFDFKVPDSEIYIDFKHWRKSMQMKKEPMHDKIFRKLEACGGKLAIVANVLEEAPFAPHKTQRNGMCILEIPSLYTATLAVNEVAQEEIWRTIYEYKG